MLLKLILTDIVTILACGVFYASSPQLDSKGRDFIAILGGFAILVLPFLIIISIWTT